MSLLNWFELLALGLVGLIATVIWRVRTSGADIVVFTLCGKAYSFSLAAGETRGTAAPLIRPVNEFLSDFAFSEEKTIEFTAEDIRPGSSMKTVLQALQGLDYEKIRLRLRTISNLNPIVNGRAEEGTIQFTCGQASNHPREFKLRSRFAPYGQSIVLEKR